MSDKQERRPVIGIIRAASGSVPSSLWYTGSAQGAQGSSSRWRGVSSGATAVSPDGHSPWSGGAAGQVSTGSLSTGRSFSRFAADLGFSFLLFLLLMEWMYPLERLSRYTEVYMIGPFGAAFAFFLFIDALRMPSGAAWVLKLGFIGAAMGWLHGGSEALTLAWWEHWAQEAVIDLAHQGAQGQLDDWEPATRTVLFLCGWCLFISVAQSFVLARKSILWFTLVTAAILLFLQIVFSLNMLGAVIRALGIGLLLQGLSHHASLSARSSASASTPASAWAVNSAAARPRLANWRSAGVVILVTAVCLAGGWFGSAQYAPASSSLNWSKVMELLEGRFASYGWGNQKKEPSAISGYGYDDSLLGRPIAQDNSLVFTALTTKLTYWRGEAKSYYSGRGWGQPNTKLVSNVLDGAMVKPGEDVLQGALVTQHITLAPGAPNTMLFSAGELVSVEALRGHSGAPLDKEIIWYEPASGKYLMPVAEDPLSSYQITAIMPAEREQLRHALNASSAEIEAKTTLDDMNEFLQLPDALPERVHQLARDIAGGEKTALEKAEAVERYLRSNYTYSLTDTRTVAAGQDLTDQFLFEQLSGYCDHFSTSMVVLMRSLGVPARWVKGFAPGDAVLSEDGSGAYRVAVHNKHAHSWPEVWIPSAGWVPFEPTPAYPGFSPLQTEPAAAEIAASQGQLTKAKASQAAGNMAALLETVRYWTHNASLSLQQRLDQLMDLTEGFKHSTARTLEPMQRWLEASPVRLFALAALMLCIMAAILLWITNKRKLSTISAVVDKTQHTHKPRLTYYRRASALRYGEKLARRIERRQGRRKPGETLREYAGSLKLSDGKREALMHFVQHLEALRYADPYREASSVTKKQLKQAWLRWAQDHIPHRS